MRKLLTLLLLFSLASIATALENIKVGTTTRQMISYAPQNLPSHPALVIACHGMNQDAPYLQNESKWELVADTAKFVVVYANGENKSWDISGDKDLKFVEAIIDTMYQRYHINRNRVYVTGFSMGGMFTYHCANNLAHKIAAFAPVSGYPMGGPNPTASRPVPIFHTHGTGDDVCVYSNVQSHIDAWVRYDGCDTTPVTDKPASGPANTPATIQRYKHGKNGVEVALLTFKDKGHWWSMDASQGLTSVEVWNFCRRWTLGADEPEVEGIQPEDHSFDLLSQRDRTFTLSFNDTIVLSGVTATLANATQSVTLEVAAGDPSKEVVLQLPADATLADGVYQLTVRNARSTKGGILESVSYQYTYGVQEVGETEMVDTLYCPDWYSERETIGEGIPAGWRRINLKSDDTKEITQQNTAGVTGVRMKYFERGGEMDAGIYLSARDDKSCTMRYGTYSTSRLALQQGNYRLSFRSIYWSAESLNARATFGLSISDFKSNTYFQAASITSTGTMSDNANQKVTGSELHTYNFTVPATDNYVLDFVMSQGWSSVIYGNILITTQPTDADLYKGAFYRQLLQCQHALSAYEPSAAQEQLAAVVAQYEGLVSTAPSVYLAATQALSRALSTYLATDPILSLEAINCLRREESLPCHDLYGRPMAQPHQGAFVIRNHKIQITK